MLRNLKKCLNKMWMLSICRAIHRRARIVSIMIFVFLCFQAYCTKIVLDSTRLLALSWFGVTVVAALLSLFFQFMFNFMVTMLAVTISMYTFVSFAMVIVGIIRTQGVGSFSTECTMLSNNPGNFLMATLTDNNFRETFDQMFPSLIPWLPATIVHSSTIGVRTHLNDVDWIRDGF